MEEKIKYEEYELTSKEYEQELENMNDQNQKRIDELETENEQLIKSFDKIKEKYDADKKELLKLEKENEALKRSLGSTGDQAKMTFHKLRNLEIENEAYEGHLRQSEQKILDLEQKLDFSLEELALLQSELEEYKLHSQEQLERLKQQLEETNTELQVKERELKKMKIQNLMFETSLHQQQAAHTNNGVNQVSASSYSHFGTMKTQNLNHLGAPQATQSNMRLSQGKSGNAFNHLGGHDNGMAVGGNRSMTVKLTSGNKGQFYNNEETRNTIPSRATTEEDHFQNHGPTLQQELEDQDGLFERADYQNSQRPDSARFDQVQGRSSSVMSSQYNLHNQNDNQEQKREVKQNYEVNAASLNPDHHESKSEIKGSQTEDLSPSVDETDSQALNVMNSEQVLVENQQIENQEESTLQVEQVEDELLVSQEENTTLKAIKQIDQIQSNQEEKRKSGSFAATQALDQQFVGRKSNTFIEPSQQRQNLESSFVNQNQNINPNQYQHQATLYQGGLDPRYMSNPVPSAAYQSHLHYPAHTQFGNQAGYGFHIREPLAAYQMSNYQGAAQGPDFDENILMEDFDIDELLESDDIEQTAFINSSKHVLGMLDNVLNSIDERINSKRNNFYGAAAYGPFGGMNYHHHGAPMQTGNHRVANQESLMRGGPGGADNFDKTRKISVLY